MHRGGNVVVQSSAQDGQTFVHAVSLHEQRFPYLQDPTDLGAPCHLHMHVQLRVMSPGLHHGLLAGMQSLNERTHITAWNTHPIPTARRTCPPSGWNIRWVVSWAQATCS